MCMGGLLQFKPKLFKGQLYSYVPGRKQSRVCGTYGVFSVKHCTGGHNHIFVPFLKALCSFSVSL